MIQYKVSHWHISDPEWTIIFGCNDFTKETIYQAWNSKLIEWWAIITYCDNNVIEKNKNIIDYSYNEISILDNKTKRI